MLGDVDCSSVRISCVCCLLFGACCFVMLLLLLLCECVVGVAVAVAVVVVIVVVLLWLRSWLQLLL